jgi:thiamine-monophosphate kinase
MGNEPTLGALGERRIIAELLAPRYAGATHFGDDCASIKLHPAHGEVLVATTDPCPPPMASMLGFVDLYYTGWLLATLNLSDLAAAGAEPLGLLTSLILPAETTISEFGRLLDGIDACCSKMGTNVVGGNLKEGAKFDLSATALGQSPSDELLTRTGATIGERVLVIGDLGAFWAGTLGYREGHIAVGDASHPLLQNVLTPTPKIAPMRALAKEHVLSAAMDNSDGLQPTLEQLGAANRAGVLLEGDALAFDEPVLEMAAKLGLEPLRLALGWGDWQILATCREEMVNRVKTIGREHDVAVFDIGCLTVGNGVRLSLGGTEGALMPLDSERFTAGSWFSAGLDGYIEKLRKAPLIEHSTDRT